MNLNGAPGQRFSADLADLVSCFLEVNSKLPSGERIILPPVLLNYQSPDAKATNTSLLLQVIDLKKKIDEILENLMDGDGGSAIEAEGLQRVNFDEIVDLLCDAVSSITQIATKLECRSLEELRAKAAILRPLIPADSVEVADRLMLSLLMDIERTMA